MHVDFTGKTAVVTGGANGIGLAIAHTLADAGAFVWIFDLKEERPEECAASMGGQGCAVDVTDPASLEAAFAKVTTVSEVGTAGQQKPGQLAHGIVKVGSQKSQLLQSGIQLWFGRDFTDRQSHKRLRQGWCASE